MIVLALLACATGPPEADDRLTLRFSAAVDGAPLACDGTYAGGLPPTTFELVDLRFFVHEVVLTAEDGADVEAPLAVDAPWQSADVALVDLTGRGGRCEGASPDTRAEVLLDVPRGRYAGMRFTLGVPPALNHLDSEDAEPPLDQYALWWGWRYGYKYLLLELGPAGQDEWPFHLGASGCTDDGLGNYDCASDNLATVALDGFDPAVDTVTLDVGALIGGSDLDGSDGCQTLPGDADCAPLFERLGLAFEGEEGAAIGQIAFAGP